MLLRLSELAGAKLYKDNPNIVDLSDPNRPAKLKDKFCEIYSNEWTDAYQKLSESKPTRSEEKIIKFLLDILLEGFAYCTQVRDIQREGLLKVILYPMEDNGNSQVKMENVEINDILARHLAEVPKLSGTMTSEQVAKAFLSKKDMKDKFGPDFETNEKYIIQCVKMCWLMQVQTPPVCLDLAAKPGDKFDNEIYKEYTKKGKKIDFIVWPPLRRMAGGDLIEKGVAQGK
ncbi:hypothetical protein ACJMK2_031572 [Sinanodonta woodiana]|uniref:Mitochondria-eating protein n=1 Tax=Sinanodonta woodiana TaxID=1069815 RepID=A0ABD3X0L9_SINWO